MFVVAIGYRLSAQTRLTLSTAFARQVLATSSEAPFKLRFFTTAVKTDSRGTRPVGVAVSPNPSIYPRPYAVVLNEYANFASVIDTGSDVVLGKFQTVFYGGSRG